MALHRSEEPVPLKDIARRQEISLPYLEHLIAPLVAGGIVKSNRGARGGVSVLKHPQDIKLIDVIVLLEGSISLVDCVNNPKVCPRTGLCVTHDIWDEVEKAMPLLRRRSRLKEVLEPCVEINRLENVADEVYRSAMGELFTSTTDITEIIKWREIYEHMESATDRCEDVANVLEGVALKHA